MIGVVPGRIITERLALRLPSRDGEALVDLAQDAVKVTVIERHGKTGGIASGFVHGFGMTHGAIASSVGHDSHNLCVVGSDPSDMRVALASLADVGGGFCVVKDGNVLARLALPLGGLMSIEDAPEIAAALEALRAASRSIGCVLPEPFLQLAFLSLPVIPSLKLTDRGLMDVDAFKLIDVRAA